MTLPMPTPGPMDATISVNNTYSPAIFHPPAPDVRVNVGLPGPMGYGPPGGTI